MTSIPSPQPPVPPSYSQRRSRVNPWLIRIPMLVFAGTILLTAILVVFLVAFQLRVQDRIVPGVYVGGIDLGGQNVDEAIATLANQFTAADEVIYTFGDGNRTWNITGESLGVSLDIGATVEEAMTIGHSGNVAEDLSTQAISWVQGKSVAPVVQYNQAAALTTLEQIASEVNQPATEPQLVITESELQIVQGQDGRVVDISATLASLDETIRQLPTNADLQLIMTTVEAEEWNLDAVASEVSTALSGPIQLTTTDGNGLPLGPWAVETDQIAALLTVDVQELSDGARIYETKIDFSTFESYLQSLSLGLIQIPQNARFHFNDETRQLELVSPSTDGRTVNITETIARLEEAVFSNGTRRVEIAYDSQQPPVHNNVTAQELGITELVAEQTTFFWGSDSNRRTNIAVAASKFDGVVIAPGEEFSFNTIMGDVSEENGFVEGKIIFGGRTIAGIGGGVCQVSTTAFRTVMHAGFPIVERNSHGYRVGYYELGGAQPGMDAAIWTPEQDFRFTNDTDYYLLIETDVFPADGSIQFRFYSTNPGRSVVIEEPFIRNITAPPPTLYVEATDLTPGNERRIDYAASGAEVTVTRKVYDTQGNIITTDDIFTFYQPWQEIIEVPPGDPRLQQNEA